VAANVLKSTNIIACQYVRKSISMVC